MTSTVKNEVSKIILQIDSTRDNQKDQAFEKLIGICQEIKTNMNMLELLISKFNELRNDNLR
jgi:hypothetical protein